MIKKIFVACCIISVMTAAVCFAYDQNLNESNGNNFGHSFGSLWHERAMLAKERLAAMPKKIEDAKVKYQYLLESAYAMHADPRKAKDLVIEQGGSVVYKLVVPIENEKGKDRIIVDYVYDKNADTVVSSYVERIPNNWTMMCYDQNGTCIILSDPKNNKLVFYSKDPTKATVLVSNK